MLLPKTWRDTLERGYVTTDMIDACALAMHARYLNWLTKAKAAERTLAKRSSDATKRRYDHALRMAYRYGEMRRALLAMLPPSGVVCISTKDGKQHYVTYLVGDRRYLQPVDAREAKEIAVAHSGNIAEIRRLKHPVYEFGNLPSLHTALSIISAIHTLDISHAIDNGSFDSIDPEWQPNPVDWANLDANKVIPLAENLAKAMPLVEEMED